MKLPAVGVLLGQSVPSASTQRGMSPTSTPGSAQVITGLELAAAQAAAPSSVASGASTLDTRRTLASSFRYAGQGPVKVAFFDADSTLRVSKTGNVAANDPYDVVLLPLVAQKLAALHKAGYLIAIVSNQGGILDGAVSYSTAEKALAYTIELIKNAGGEVHYFDFAEGYDVDRKPEIGMGQRLDGILQARFGVGASIDKQGSMMVGDSAYTPQDLRPDGKPGTHHTNSDRLFAENFGIPFAEPQHFFGWSAHGVDGFSQAAEVAAFWGR